MLYLMSITSIVFGFIAGFQNDKWLMVAWFGVSALFNIAACIDYWNNYVNKILLAFADSMNKKKNNQGGTESKNEGPI